MIDGIYKVCLVGQGTGNGVVMVNGSTFCGGDNFFYYHGVIHGDLGDITVNFKVARHTPGEGSVFGRDDIDLVLSGSSGAQEFMLNAPGNVFSITGNWLKEAA